MSSASEDAEAAAERLEAALERIARSAARPSRADGSLSPEKLEQIAQGLEVIIARLRTALNGKP